MEDIIISVETETYKSMVEAWGEPPAHLAPLIYLSDRPHPYIQHEYKVEGIWVTGTDPICWCGRYYDDALHGKEE